ncbi:hypothetical protein AB4144_56100, partial [Rhizobiaceae sp. 2RAB30]
MVGELGFKALRKVCIVTCSSGPGLKSDLDDMSIGQSVLGTFCGALAGKQLTPMIAAYRGFVTVSNKEFNMKGKVSH